MTASKNMVMVGLTRDEVRLIKAYRSVRRAQRRSIYDQAIAAATLRAMEPTQPAQAHGEQGNG